LENAAAVDVASHPTIAADNVKLNATTSDKWTPVEPGFFGYLSCTSTARGHNVISLTVAGCKNCSHHCVYASMQIIPCLSSVVLHGTLLERREQ